MLVTRGEWPAIPPEAHWLAADGADGRYGLAVALLRLARRLASWCRRCSCRLASVSQETGGVLLLGHLGDRAAAV